MPSLSSLNVHRLAKYERKDTKHPHYVICWFRDVSTNETTHYTIDWNNTKARRSFLGLCRKSHNHPHIDVYTIVAGKVLKHWEITCCP